MNLSLIIVEVKYGAIYTDDSSCRSYYIIKFSLSPYIFQSDMIIDGQVIYFGEMVCEDTYFSSININARYYFLQNN